MTNPQPPNSHNRGFGLFSIKERLDFLGGNLVIKSETDGGTTITIEFPLQPKD